VTSNLARACVCRTIITHLARACVCRTIITHVKVLSKWCGLLEHGLTISGGPLTGLASMSFAAHGGTD
jgi:hypothetical protein